MSYSCDLGDWTLRMFRLFLINIISGDIVVCHLSVYDWFSLGIRWYKEVQIDF